MVRLNDISHYFTTGEFAQRAGVTSRTLRYYDSIGLLKPSKHNEAGNRLYTMEDFARLQKIMTLKFIGLSLNDIFKIVRYEINDTDFKKSLELQRKIIEGKIAHMQMVAKAVDETLTMLKSDNTLNWNKFINIINVINIGNKWMEQYENASNLRARIKIHELYSTNKYGWMRWFFEKFDIPQNSRILELGCGDASLWYNNLDRIPRDWDITLTDFSLGMLGDAVQKLGKSSKRFKFKLMDAQDITFKNDSFDVVIADHMLYHVPDIEKAFKEIKRVLKPQGYLFASTVGKSHMAEMREILGKFDSKLITTKSWDETRKFQLENGKQQISRWFSDVIMERYKDSLEVTDAVPLIDYIFSMPGNVKESFDKDKLKQLTQMVQNIIHKNGEIHITKDTGYFKARKYV